MSGADEKRWWPSTLDDVRHPSGSRNPHTVTRQELMARFASVHQPEIGELGLLARLLACKPIPPNICSCPLQQVQTIRMTRRTAATRQAAAASARQRQLTTTTTRLRCASLALPLPALLHPTCFIARDLLGASQAEPCKLRIASQPYEERVAELQKEVNSLKEQLEKAQRSAKHWQKEAEKWNSKLNNMEWERLTKWCRSDSGDSAFTSVKFLCIVNWFKLRRRYCPASQLMPALPK